MSDLPMCLACELDNCSDCEDWIELYACCCGRRRMSDEEIAEERLRSCDYESWAAL